MAKYVAAPYCVLEAPHLEFLRWVFSERRDAQNQIAFYQQLFYALTVSCRAAVVCLHENKPIIVKLSGIPVPSKIM